MADPATREAIHAAHVQALKFVIAYAEGNVFASGLAHPGALFTFVTDGVAAAIEQAKAIADGKNIAVASAGIARQCLELG